MKKKIISSILSLAMLLSLLPVAAFAAYTSTPSLKLGFEAEAEKADTALGITGNDSAAAHCDPNTMYVLINDAQKDDQYTVKVTKDNTNVYTQETFKTQAVGGVSKVYFAFGYTEADKGSHSVAETALAAGNYLFTVTRERAGEVSTRTATLTLTGDDSNGFTAGTQSEIKDIAFTSTGFAADAARANKALGIADSADASAKCDPNTMWAKFTLDGSTGSKYTMKVTNASNAEVYTEAELQGDFTKAYFTVDKGLVDSKPANHSVAKIAAAEGTYTFALTAKDDNVVLAQATLTLGKLTVKSSDSDTNPTEIFFNANGEETVGVLIPDIADPTTPPTEGKVFTGWKTGSGNPITTATLKNTALTQSVEYVAQWGDASTPVEKPLSVQSAGFAWGYADGNRESGKTDCLDQTMWLNVTGGDVAKEYFFDVVKDGEVFYSESFRGYGAGVSGTPRWSYVHKWQNQSDKVLTPGAYTINVYDNEAKTGTPVRTTVTVPAFPTNNYALTVVANNNVTSGEGVITATMPTALKGRYYVELSQKDDTSEEFLAVAGKSFGTEADPNDTANKGGLFGTNVYQPIKFEGLSLTANGEYRVAIYQRSSTDTAENPSKAANSGYLVSGTVTVDNTVVAPATVPPVMGEKIPSDTTTQDAVKAAAENISTNDVAMAAAVAKTDVTEPTTAEINDAAAKLKVDADDLKTVVQHYTQVTATDYKKDGSDNAESITFDIKPMYRVVVTNATNPSEIEVNGEKQNAVVVGEGAKELEIKEPVAMTIGLPAGFAISGTKVYVQHEKTNPERTYEYTTTVKADGNQKLSVEFVNPHGFSTFTVSKNSTAVAEIDGVGYTTLQQAVDAAKNNDIITLKSDLTGDNAKATISGTTNKTINFVLDANVTGPVNLTINGDTVTVNKANGGNYTYVVPSEEDKPSTGGGGGVSSNVTIDRPTNGKVSVTPTAPSKGATVTINLTPDAGYAVGTVTVTDKDGKAVELTKVNDTQYTFTMPDGKVTVKATFTKVDAPATGFTDVPADAYYADAVKWAVDKGITNGLTATTFGPNNSCTRGQMVTFLWRAAGSPAVTGTNSFSDVASGEYYYDAVLWAVEKGITNGTSATTFSPNTTVTRGQTVTFLYRYAESPAATGDTSFTDVTADAFYADAVKWAVAEEITNGTSSTTFSPTSNCTRGQIVTFMYRQMAE